MITTRAPDGANKICSTIVQEYVHSAFSSLCGRSKCNLICVVIWGGNEEDKTDFNHIFLPARLPTAALTISQGGSGLADIAIFELFFQGEC